MIRTAIGWVLLGGCAAIAGFGCLPARALATAADRTDSPLAEPTANPIADPTGDPTGDPIGDRDTSTILEEIRTTGILRVAVASRAVPLSFRYPDGRLEGFCLDLIDDVATALTDRLDLDRRPLVEIVTSQLGTRFDLVRDGDVHLECGPNTIREVEGIAFSAPFLVTGVQFIAERGGDRNPLAAQQVGALQNSSTLAWLRERYDEDAIAVFAGTLGVRRGIEALQGELDAFATDALLTIGELAVTGLALDNYRIYPNEPLACSPYGLLVPAGEPDWLALVDGVITGEAGVALWETWFVAIDDYLQPAEEFCGVEVVPAETARDRRERRERR